MKTLIILVGLCGLLFLGCSYSLSSIRQNEPSYTFTSSKSTKEVAKSIEYRGRAEVSSFWQVNPTFTLEEYPDQTYRIVLIDPTFGTGIGDCLIKPKDGGSSIEYRRGHPWYGEAKFLEVLKKSL